MSAISLENYCEALCVLLLKNNAALTAVIPPADIVRETEDSDASKNRIFCKASPREVETTGLNPSTVLVWRVGVAVTLNSVDLAAAQIDTACASIETAMGLAYGSFTAAMLTILTAAKIRCQDNTSEGDFTTEDNARKRSKRYNLLSELT